jgi:hypothetical protein
MRPGSISTRGETILRRELTGGKLVILRGFFFMYSGFRRPNVPLGFVASICSDRYRITKPAANACPKEDI